MKRYDKFEFDGHEYNLKPLPITTKKFRRKGMFEKNHVTFELILTCLAGVTAFAATLIFLMKWFA